MRPGEFVLAGRRHVRVEDVKDDGGKVKLCGQWVPAGGVKVLPQAMQEALERRERQRTDRMWRQTERLVRRIVRLIEQGRF